MVIVASSGAEPSRSIGKLAAIAPAENAMLESVMLEKIIKKKVRNFLVRALPGVS
jgi:hypothetical protein